MSRYDIKASTELMQNYLQSDIMDPTQERFRAVESGGGTALLFSVGTDGSLHLTAEQPGDSANREGWHRFDLSAGTAPEGFSPGGAHCHKFDVARCADGSLRMAMVLKDRNNEDAAHALYLAVTAPHTEHEWFKSPVWVRHDYDGEAARPQLKIVNVFLGDADHDYALVDVNDAPNHPTNIARYFVEPNRREGDPAWRPHDLDAEIQADSYTTCVGRRKKTNDDDEKLDGIYTAGHIGDAAQILYAPLHGRKGRAGLSSALYLPGKLKPDAIASCRNTDNTSDLYVAAAGALYYFESGNQDENAVAVRVITGNSRLAGVQHLFASQADDSVVVWGLNADKEIFYVTCPLDKRTHPSAWSNALPIMSGVQHVAPFVNRTNSANTFFAHLAGEKLKVAVRKIDAKAPGSRTWSQRDIHLSPPDRKKKQKARSFRSYTTRVQVTGPDKRPAGGRLVSIAAPNGVTSVYINHLYYVVGATPIHVKTDPLGSLTIVEAVSRLDGTHFDLSAVDGEGSFKTNPMEDAPNVKRKLQQLQNGGLGDAYIHYQDKTIKPRKLVKSGASAGDVTAAQRNIDNLWSTYHHLQTTSSQLRSTGKAPAPMPAERSPEYKALVGERTPTAVDAGDLLSVLEAKHAQHVAARAQGATALSGWSDFWEAIVEFFEGVWNFVVKIGEEIFTFVFEFVEQVFAAFKYVFNKVVETIDDLIEFAQFLFDSDDIKRTKDVMKNVIVAAFRDRVAAIEGAKKDIDKKLSELEEDVKGWAKIDWGKTLGDAGKAPLDGETAPSPADGPPEWLLAHHFQANVEYGTPVGANKLPDDSSAPVSILQKALQTEERALQNAFSELEKLAKDLPTLTLADAAKRLAGIAALLGLETAKTVVDAVLDGLVQSAEAAITALDQDIYIPIVSDILEFLGFPDFSVLDVICYVGAVPATIAFKAATGKPPFPEGPTTTLLMTETDFQKILAGFSGSGPARNLASSTPPELVDANADVYLAFRFLSGLFAAVSTVAAVPDTIAPDVPVAPAAFDCWKLAIVGLNTAAGMSHVICTYFPPLNPRLLTSSEAWFNQFVAILRLCVLAVLGGLATFGKVSKTVTTGVDAIFVVVQLFATIINFADVNNAPNSDSKELATVDEIGVFAALTSRLCRSVAAWIPDPDTKLILAGGMVAFGLTFAATQFYEFHIVLQIKKSKSATNAA